MAASSEADVAARLIERLLADPAFRARFRRDPAGACREAGLDDLAQEMSVAGGKAMMTRTGLVGKACAEPFEELCACAASGDAASTAATNALTNFIRPPPWCLPRS